MATKEEILENLKTAIEELDEDLGAESAQAAYEMKIDPAEAISGGLGLGMQTLSDLFDEGEAFVPQLVVAAEIFEDAVSTITQDLASEEKSSTTLGKVLICTVESDIHDIGKNIVKTMLSASGFEVIDGGRDLPSSEVVKMAQENNVDIIAAAALMTTTMPAQRDIVSLLKEEGIRDNFKVMFGGAPVSPAWVESVGGDAYAENAAEAVEKAKSLMAEIKAGA